MKRAASVATVILLSLTAPACRGGDASGGEPVAVPFITIDAARASTTDQAIGAAQDRLRVAPTDDESRLLLAQGFLQRAREVADPTLYGRAETLIRDLLERRPDDPGVLIASGTLALAQHRFEDALEDGTDALAAAPASSEAYGVLVDANNELGLYDESLRHTESMVNAKPSLASYSRVSYARELRGDLNGAIGAMTQAVAAGGFRGGENTAYVQTLLGDLLLKAGRASEARTQYEAAERSFAGFGPVRAGLARVLVSEGRIDEASSAWDEIVRSQPLPDYLQDQGDSLTAIGRVDDGRRAYELVDVTFDLYDENGVQSDLERAAFDADHRAGNDAVDRARRAVESRPTAVAHDVLAWNQYRDGRVDDAARTMERALALGTREPLIRFHAAVIADARGDTDRARAELRHVLDTNPRFSAVFAPQVVELAVRLGLAPPPMPVAPRA